MIGIYSCTENGTPIKCGCYLMTYPGGKSGPGVFQTLINQIPPHGVYVSATVGQDAVLQNIQPANRSIAIDPDPSPLKWWAQRRKDVELYNCCGVEWLEWTFSNHRFMPARSQKKAFLERFRDWFVFIDAPYPVDVRSSKKRMYAVEQMEWPWHKRMLQLAKTLPCMVMICCYPNDVYDDALSDWRTKDYFSTARSGEKRRERIWMNYDEPKSLHDYRYLGKDKRQRERIKRQQKNFKTKLERMTDLERKAIIRHASAIIMESEQ